MSTQQASGNKYNIWTKSELNMWKKAAKRHKVNTNMSIKNIFSYDSKIRAYLNVLIVGLCMYVCGTNSVDRREYNALAIFSRGRF